MTLELWKFVSDSLLDWRFGICLILYLLLALVIWQKGYRILEWIRQKPMSVKVSIIIVSLLIFYTIGCIPQDKSEQRYGWWFALPVATVIGSSMVLACSIINRFRYHISTKETRPTIPESYRRQRNIVLLAKAMFWIWSLGWGIYFVAIGIAHQPHVGAEVLLRSAVASLDLFWMDIDTNVLDALDSHDVLKGMLVCASFAAVVCLATLIMSLVLSRLMAFLHLKNITINSDRNHLYVFFGLGDASKILAKSILREDEKSVVVFVENSLAGEAEQDEDKTDGWKNIVSLLTHRRKTFIDADENERRALAIANCDICGLEGDETDVLGNIGLEIVKQLLAKLKETQEGQLHVFFLSENRDNNVRATSILAKDQTISNPAFQTIIYCHARRNGVNRIIEDLDIIKGRNLSVKILDSSHLAVESLKSHKQNHPVNFVKVRTLNESNPGTVSSPLECLVVGFGETGQEVVKFLYEFGAFVSSSSSAGHSERTPFHCYVIDKDMEMLEGQFISEIPAVKCKRSSDSDIADAPIKFYPLDFNTDGFYTEVLKKIVQAINYVVVAVGDDETNMTVAVEILRYVRRYRNNLDDFCIYVRAYEKGSFKYLKDIKDHYNLRLSEDGETPVEKIKLFGGNEEIYTYNLVVRDQYEIDGRVYYEAYRSLQIDPANDEGSWEERRESALTKKRGTKWERMSKIKRKESQDRSNAIHAKTKILLLEKAVGEENARDFGIRVLKGRDGRQSTISYPHLNFSEDTLMLNLAMCEHLRWNAAHEMMGYVNNRDGHECNELRKKHNCLKPWEELDKESDAVDYIDDYKLFDYGVVETSFKLEYMK